MLLAGLASVVLLVNVGLGDMLVLNTLSVSDHFLSGFFSSLRNNSFFISSKDCSAFVSDSLGLYRPVDSSCSPCCFAKRFLIKSSKVDPGGSLTPEEDEEEAKDVAAATTLELDPLTVLSKGLIRSPVVPNRLLREGQSVVVVAAVEGLLAFRVNKEETYDDADPDVKDPSTALLLITEILLLLDDVAVEGRDGMGGGACCGGKEVPSSLLLLLKLKLLAFFVPLLLLLSPTRAGSGGGGGAVSPSSPSPSDSEVLPCFFLNAKSYMSPNMPAKVFRRFFIVSSASSTTDDCDC